MYDLDAEAKQWNDQAQRFATFTGVIDPDPNDRFFLVMGMTGSGKSTFIARCVGQDVTTGHGLYSCTSEVQVYSFMYRGRRNYLIDTPGFNDTNRSDLDTLDFLATSLGASYANGVRIHGIIMLHPITDNRMNGSSLQNIEMMKAMCGFTNYKSLAIATTMWPKDPHLDEQQIFNDREHELQTNSRFFGTLIAQGASLFRHNESENGNLIDEARSAKRIRELVDQDMTLGETKAGRAVAGELYKARQEHESQIRDIKLALKGTMAKMDNEHAAQLQELGIETEAEMKKIQREQKALNKSMQDLHKREKKVWEQKMEALEKKFQDRVAEKEQELYDMEESLAELRKDMARQSLPHRQETQIAREDEEYEEMVDNTRKELIQARNAQQAFHEQKKTNVVNGLVNGVAAGTTSGIIAAVAAGGLICSVM
ncbi:P-loop containing nucleoside triphosphate hydrolase protein [Dactylonectria estremocensis]|uniref:P-loop containing nucleoside triphosphate hydrolase protein n=1 Tax=Dactylonectria estremocensis TaxID=1079267 RepID=A0A9P9ICI7_9HYPO|nr:P-loop containing nucleoside triphosphate hydrolase protein [Dactylonectria estremocensis]